MSRIFIITGTEIEMTGTVSYKFMFDSGAEFTDYADISGMYGLLELKEKDDNYFSPWKVAEAWQTDDPVEKKRLIGEAIGSDGILRWNVNVFESGHGLNTACGVDDDLNGEGLRKLVKELPDCVLLMHRGIFDRIESVCNENGVELGFHHFDGKLATS